MEETRGQRFARWTLRRERRGWEVIVLLAAAIALLAVAGVQDAWLARAFWGVCGVGFLASALTAFLQGQYLGIIRGLEAENARLRAQRSAG